MRTFATKILWRTETKIDEKIYYINETFQKIISHFGFKNTTCSSSQIACCSSSFPELLSKVSLVRWGRKVKRFSLNIWHKWQVISIAIVVVIAPVWYRVMSSHWRAESWVDHKIGRKLTLRIFAGFQNITAVMSPGPPEIWTSLPQQQLRCMLKRARKKLYAANSQFK